MREYYYLIDGKVLVNSNLDIKTFKFMFGYNNIKRISYKEFILLTKNYSKSGCSKFEINI